LDDAAKCLANSNGFDNSGTRLEINNEGFSFGVTDSLDAVSVKFGDIEELDTKRRVVWAEQISTLDFNATSATYISPATGAEIVQVNLTATMTNGATLLLNNRLFAVADTIYFQDIKIPLTSNTNKLGITILDWPFQDYQNTLRVTLSFSTSSASDICSEETSRVNQYINQVRFQTPEGVVTASALLFAELDGEIVAVETVLNSSAIVVESRSFLYSYVYDPDFSILLGGGAGTSNGCGGLLSGKDLLYASIAALCSASSISFVVMVVFYFISKEKIKAKKARKARLQAAYKSGLGAPDSYNGVNEWD